MLGEKHDLVEEFPEHKERIHELKMSDKHFAHLYDKYNGVNDEIIKIEEGLEASSDDYVEKLKIQRLHIKDDILSVLAGAS